MSFNPGDTVYLEGVVVQSADPVGHVLVALPAATDENHLLDGVTVWQPRALVHRLRVDIPVGATVYDIDTYTATEGFYPESLEDTSE